MKARTGFQNLPHGGPSVQESRRADAAAVQERSEEPRGVELNTRSQSCHASVGCLGQAGLIRGDLQDLPLTPGYHRTFGGLQCPDGSDLRDVREGG